MENFLQLFESFKFKSDDFERVFIREGATPDTVCAALAHRLDTIDAQTSYSITGNQEAQSATRLAMARLISILAEHTDVTEDEIEELVAIAIGPEQEPIPAAPAWKYPIVNAAPGNGRFNNSEFKQFSALKMFGYTVGKTDGWPTAKRSQFLTDFMTCELPPEVEQVFGNEYGAPMTAERLRKVANVIASNCSNFIRNDEQRYRVAISQWKADLHFLEKEFYEGRGLQFDPWPTLGR